MRYLFCLLLFGFLFNFSSCAKRVVATPARVTVVKTAPRHHKIIRIKGSAFTIGAETITVKPETALFW